MPFHLPWDWSADYQRQTCLELAKRHMVVVYIHNDARFFLKIRPRRKFPSHNNIHFYQPCYLFPFRRFPLIEKWNQLFNIFYISWRYGGQSKKVVLWVFDAVFWFYPYVRYMNPRIISLYDCVDYVWSRDKNIRHSMQSMERKLIRNVDYFFVNSHTLYYLHQKTRKPNIIVPQGFRLDDYRKPLQPVALFPKDKPIVGFIGGINHRLDFRLITRLIKNNPELYFVLWGKIQETDWRDVKKTTSIIHYLATFPNVILGYSKANQEVPSIIAQFDIGIIPYRINLYSNRYCFPMKLFEYFYMGKPVISSPIIEVLRYSNLVNVGSNIDDWERHIHTLLSTKWQKKQKDVQLKEAKENSWKKKIDTILANLK